MILLFKTVDSSDSISEVGARGVEKNWVTLHRGERCRRSGMMIRYHDTFEMAKYYLRRLQELRLRHLEQRVIATKLAIKRINAKTKPDYAHECTKDHPDTLFHRE